VQLYPTRSTFHVALAGIGLVTLGTAARIPPVVAFGGAMILAVALGRAVAILKIRRLRAAGFEMVWSDGRRVHRTTRGGSLVLQGELRNRSDERVRASALRAVASSLLDVSIEPAAIDLEPGGRATFDVTVGARRIGRWGVHGVALEVTATPFGAEGLHEIPLLFANPLGIEVLPAIGGAGAGSARSRWTRRDAETGRLARASGEADEVRELRDHVPGDPFKRIAWKASARRGRLLVRELERDERDVVWLVVDASVELWAGPPGEAPLDRVADDVATLAARHLRGGARVGLVVGASRLRTWIEPEAGAAHTTLVASALASMAAVVDADRSELDEAQVAARVAEHARPFDPHGLVDLPRGDLGALATRAEQLRGHAPFSPRLPFAPTPREQSLRHYLASFGIESPPRVEGERAVAESTLGLALERLRAERPRPSVVHVWAPPPTNVVAMAKHVAGLRRRGTELRWTLPPFDAGLGEGSRSGGVADVADEAVRMRTRATRQRGERTLRRLGVRVVVSLSSGAAAAAREPVRIEPAVRAEPTVSFAAASRPTETTEP
jgi:uncharacterized protein (DUF58 family)